MRVLQFTNIVIEDGKDREILVMKKKKKILGSSAQRAEIRLLLCLLPETHFAVLDQCILFLPFLLSMSLM
jgi:hypothetical protein